MGCTLRTSRAAQAPGCSHRTGTAKRLGSRRPVLRVLTSCTLSGPATRGGRAGSCPPCNPCASPGRGSSGGRPAVSGRPGPGVWTGLCPHATEPGHVPRTSSEHGTGPGLVPHIIHMLDTQRRIISETPAIVATREQQSTTTSARACLPRDFQPRHEPLPPLLCFVRCAVLHGCRLGAGAAHAGQ